VQPLKKQQKLSLNPQEIENWDQLPYEYIIGTDEVGRGCLAGPVVSCAVKFNNISELSQFKDSKTISEKRRETLFEELSQTLSYGIGIATVEEIDEINILQASLLSMKRAVEVLEGKCPELKTATKKLLLLDGNQIVPGLTIYDQAPVIKGDQKISLISAASVLAKVYRDRLMKSLAVEFPDYGFEVHKGYATELHRTLIEKNGPSKWHRQSFKGVKEYVLRT
jgi:ribonuclease HII